MPRKISPLKVLVVDDDPVDRQLIAEAFTDSQIAVDLSFAANGQHALKRLTEQENGKLIYRPSLCIFDINMPGVSGIELLEKVKAHSELRKIPVIMLSSSDDKRDIAKCYDLQASGYVRKPDNYHDLLALVRGITDYWSNTLSLPDRVQTIGAI